MAKIYFHVDVNSAFLSWSALKALQDGGTGRIAIYYGAADTNVGLAFTTVDEVVTYIKAHSKLQWGDDIAQDDF